MAQRHQIYIFYDPWQNDKGIQCIAFHNQWCYGSLPLRHTYRFAKFQKNADEENRISAKSHTDIIEKFQALLSLDLENGFYHYTFDITSEVINKKSGIDPDKGDNNDGITIIYVPKDATKIKYCFMNIGDGDSAVMKAPPRIPLSARQYAKLYYEKGSKKWKGFGIEKYIKYLNKNAQLLTPEECQMLLPDWYIQHASKDELPLLINCKPVNMNKFEKRLKGKPLPNIKGQFVSVWEEGTVSTSCELDPTTGELFPVTIETENDLGSLEREYFQTPDGEELTVCPTCRFRGSLQS
jgi:hypothetical protein